jgi:hypothetical protein
MTQRTLPKWRALPFRRWPLAWHMGFAAASLVALAFALYAFHAYAAHTVTQMQADYVALQDQLLQKQAGSLPAMEYSEQDVILALPARATADDVVRDMGHQGQNLGIAISSLVASYQAASTTASGSVQWSITVAGEYPKVKAWLGSLLDRYASLAIQSFAVRPVTADAAQQEWQLVFVMYVKD